MINQETGEVTLGPLVSPILKACYAKEEEQIYHDNLQDSPHGERWHTSFHASSFPGLDPKACPRQALYTLLDFPPNEPVNHFLRSIMEVGKAVEESVVWRFARAGILLTPDPASEFQLNLLYADAWLSGAPDAIIKTPKGGAHVVEIKTKGEEKVNEMTAGLRSYDELHKVQLFTYMGLLTVGELQEIPPITGGSILYLSRDNPSNICEYRFDVPDKSFFDEGVAKLKDWRESFLSDTLPERPKDWKWTENPCKYCKFKKFVCKPDHKAGVTKLSESKGIDFAKEIRENYDYETVIKEVYERWGE